MSFTPLLSKNNFPAAWPRALCDGLRAKGVGPDISPAQWAVRHINNAGVPFVRAKDS
ncbi:hypothetical protein DSCO28_02700 [Desulfosarcina ovata subsp. sediminis]|uniref:Uncharacterized protein n=1 Tax=Desulfosarcina ovata subsp. sediminis TaxID=885957 RepID=A0A5K7ZEM0_9BACT|nr:hypothetical protein DSCO28_02700 [Desulfosarcina ovata subsp. sediminis]